MTRRPQKRSSKSADKRRQIIDAARNLLLREGFDACTSRALATETGMSSGLVHYYFENISAVIDCAMAEIVDQISDLVRTAIQDSDDPTTRLWAAVETYLSAFADQPGLTLLWFDYWSDLVHGGQVKPVANTYDQLTTLLAEAFADVGVADPDLRARSLLAYLLGTLVRRQIYPQATEELHAEIATLFALDPVR